MVTARTRGHCCSKVCSGMVELQRTPSRTGTPRPHSPSPSNVSQPGLLGRKSGSLQISFSGSTLVLHAVIPAMTFWCHQTEQGWCRMWMWTAKDLLLQVLQAALAALAVISFLLAD